MTPSNQIAGIVLAAGRSTRMGHFKLLAEIAGTPMLRRVVEAVRASRVARVIVVTGNAADAVGAALAGLDVELVHNPDYALGLSTSLAAGLAALPAETAGALVLLGDMPHVTTGTIDSLLAAFEPGHVVVPVRGGAIGNPVLWPREAFSRMRALTGDAGARKLLPEFAGRVREVEIADAGIFLDIDTPEALAEIRSRTSPGR